MPSLILVRVTLLNQLAFDIDIIPADVYNFTMKNNTLLSSREAAERLGLSQDHVRRLLGDRILRGKKIGNSWVVLGLNYKRKRRPKEYKKEKEDA